MPITRFIAVDLPEPFGPIRPKISPLLTSKPRFFTAVNPPKRFGQAADFEPRAGLKGTCIHYERALAREGRSEEAGRGKGNSTTSSATAETMKSQARRAEAAGIRRRDQEDRADCGAEHGAPTPKPA